ncbi:GNAT family N-acetyltransferase [Ralstonia pickettii]|nr:GNAT family N-acetyltransferase [Ralstonia pickettii]
MFQYEVDEDITLKPISEADAKALFQLTDSSRENLREWLPWLDGTKKEEDSLDFIENSIKNYEAKKSLNCGIFYRGKLAGMAGFNSIDWTNRVGYIGYWLAEAFQGKGIMTRAVRGLTDYAFQDLELNRIDIRAATGNKKSRAIPERLGFKEEGIIRQAEWLYDHFADHVIYGMLKSDWK